MAFTPRIVVDTNVLVSALLAAGSVPGQAMTKAEDSCHWKRGLSFLKDIAMPFD